jgi:hypothetical protein
VSERIRIDVEMAEVNWVSKWKQEIKCVELRRGKWCSIARKQTGQSSTGVKVLTDLF